MKRTNAVSLMALAALGLTGLVSVVACGSSSSDNGAGTGDGGGGGSGQTSTSAVDAFCSKYSSAVKSCSTSDACDLAEADNCPTGIGNLYSNAYLTAALNCPVTCGDAGITSDDSCDPSASLPATQAFTDLGTAYCAACPSTNCTATFASSDDDGGLGDYGQLKGFNDSVLEGIKTSCTGAALSADAGAFGCQGTFALCAYAYIGKQTTEPAACQEDAGN